MANHQTPRPEVISFADALAAVPETTKRHLLLGNGFSRALRDDVFSYTALLEQADFTGLSPTARNAFTALGTTDFEVVMRALRNASALIALYAPGNKELPVRLREDADGLRELLVTTIATNHPNRPSDIAAEAYVRCRTFLANFHTIYTLNYDLLLYWAIMQQELEPAVQFDDGFRTPEDGPAAYVTWEVERTSAQSVFYLHGGLHIFDAGTEIQKFTWINTGIALIDQIREALLSDRYPLFVAEGETAQKLARIKHSDFLGRAYRSFSQITGALFVYGHSMAPNDEHIMRLIERIRSLNSSSDFIAMQLLRVAKGLFNAPTRSRKRVQYIVPLKSISSSISAQVWSGA
jgi:hypothetical protein